MYFNNLPEDKLRVLYRSLWNNCIIGLAKVDANNQFIVANNTFCNIVGYSEAELQNRTWMSITHPEDVAGNLAMTTKIKDSRDQENYTMSKRYITKQGNIVWVIIDVLSIKEKDETFSLFLIQVRVPEQHIGAPISKAPAKLELRENIKWIISAIAGLTLSIVGSFQHNDVLQNAGLGLLGVALGGYALVKK